MPARYPRSVSLILLFLLINSAAILACTCGGEFSFCDEINDNSDAGDQATHVLKVVKQSDFMHGMIVQPILSYINSVVSDPFVVWGDPGHLCRPYTSWFENGDTIIVGIKEIEYPYGPEEIGDFYISICGVNFLTVNNGRVQGSITPSVGEMDIAAFDEYMLSEGYKENCEVSAVVNSENDKNEILVYPNPASEFVKIDYGILEIPTSLTLLNADGSAVKYLKSMTEVDSKNLDVRDLPAGVYLLKMNWRERLIVKRMVISH